MPRLRAVLISVLVLACRQPAVVAPRPGSISTGRDASLRAFIDSLVEAQEFSNAHWGILVVDPERGDTLYSRNAGKLFMPASNMKILTSATALTQLGADFRYRTTFGARGQVSGGTLTGDLVVIGRGDPSVSDHMLHDAMLPIRAIADSIAARGIHHVTGRVAAAGDHFPGSELGFGWSYDDFEDSYSAPVDELLFNEGFSELHVKAGERAGDPVTVVVRPARSMPRVRVNASTVAAAPGDSARRRANTLVARKDSTSWDVILTGTLAARDTAVIEVTHHNATDAYLAAVREALADRGVSFDDQPTDTLARVDTIATLTSPPLSEILKALMKPSQNQIAEMLFRTTALEKSGAGRPDSARAIVERQIASWGAAVPQEAVVRDGSGLSRYDYISPQTVVRILDAMKKAPTFGVFYDALPIAGVDGTIRNRMKGTPAENNVHAKTGSVAQSRSLSGYVTTADRHMLIFSFLSNNWTVPIRSVERVQDAIAVRLAAMRLR
ncbi:MAG TPA: D-alanyl-D-alanine carboxypeptidase/D-alanyl-D-alanine-endopeptidase [Gemmatimonadaceae bacterium]|jgi:serine-type D-Ala-D-Ala carboxypeptidase/endopeptidase (penicillin-binding protein 4)|nr:D-alanyl-D-alanine carboxypeptidase/D-alanyl-D-alanine-endopeptidase [Gemmatimonadaceae bacterium]